MSQAIVRRPPANNCGSAFRRPFVPGIAFQTFGKRTKKSCPTNSTPRVAKSLGRRHTLSVGIIPYDNGWRASCARPCHFPSQRTCTSFVCDSFYTATISRLPLLIEPLPRIYKMDGMKRHRSILGFRKSSASCDSCSEKIKQTSRLLSSR